MKVISIYNFKGGTGKTSISFLLSNYMAMNDKKVLLIDFDPQASLTKSFPESDSKTVYDLLSESCNIKDCIKEVKENLFLISGSFRTLKLQNNVMHSFVKDNLKKLKYDFCIIDNSPTLNNLVVSCLQASNLILIPSLISKYDLNETLYILSQIKQISPDAKAKVILNRTQKSSGEFTKLENEYKNTLRVNGNLLQTTIPNSNLVRKFIDLGENPFIGKTLAKITFTELFHSIAEEIK